MTSHIFEITKVATFDAAHFLPDGPADSPYTRLHGHSFQVEATVAGAPQPPVGWVADLAELDSALRAVARNDGIDDFRPVVDGNALPFDPFSPAGLDHHADIPMIAGSTREEMTFFMAYDGEGVFDMPEARARQRVADFFHMSLADSAPLFPAPLRDYVGGDNASIRIENCNSDVRRILAISNFEQLFTIR
mgnify:CR=1 FL=1